MGCNKRWEFKAYTMILTKFKFNELYFFALLYHITNGMSRMSIINRKSTRARGMEIRLYIP